MKVLANVIEEQLVKEDIEGLLELGAPVDEYHDEAKEIALLLENTDLTQESIRDAIKEVWISHFDLEGDDLEARSQSFEKVADQIFELAA